ncbi:hypothetical protein [Mesorhizobium sp. M1060]|uniref:hypothetical protein n=1 Tax=Mesorhizobium sp. M1060 TaxID=2957052 RepID=UPI00269F4B87
MFGAGDLAVPLDLAWIAQVDEDGVLVVEQPGRFLGRDHLDLGIGLVEQLAIPFFHG